ncbi:MAG: glycosyltransferase family 2 protein [Chloroflexi bacterium]|nr:glycosyltransferase family 2 protein [Chloroflexota bacterium]
MLGSREAAEIMYTTAVPHLEEQPDSARTPFASIVIPTHNRREQLHATLEALRCQDCSPESFEVIVIADGCADGTIALVRAWAQFLPFRIHRLTCPGVGPAAARNLGITRARGEVIVFLDDDVVPVRGWLSAHLDHHTRTDHAVVIGPLSPGIDPERPLWVRWEDRTLQKQYQAMLAGHYGPTPRQFYTGNSSVRRRWLEAVGGFDPSLRRAEDVELAYRLQDLGLAFIYEPRADGKHNSYRPLQVWVSIPELYARVDVAMARDRARIHLLQSILDEFVGRHWAVQRLTKLCLGHPAITQQLVWLLTLTVLVANRTGLHRLGFSCCSALWNLRYWQGLATALGSPAVFWQLVERPQERSSTLARALAQRPRRDPI